MNVCIVVVTHNRLEYTRKTIARLLVDSSEEFDLYLWDNASSDETPDYLKSLKDNRITEVILSKENLGQTGAMNYCWGKTKAELIGKLDNDCLVTPGWTMVFSKAHQDVENFGAIACWHFAPEEFDELSARKAGKIQSFGCHQVVRHSHVCGSGFIMKRRTFEKFGQWKVGPDVGTTYYFMQMALGGYVNGWYYPFVLQEHMDDPASEHSMLKNDASVRALYNITYTLRTKKLRTLKSRWARRSVVLKNICCDPWDAHYYVGWKARVRRIRNRVGKLLRRSD